MNCYALMPQRGLNFDIPSDLCIEENNRSSYSGPRGSLVTAYHNY